MASVKFGASSSSSDHNKKPTSHPSSFYHNRYGNTDETRQSKAEIEKKQKQEDPTIIFDLETPWFNAKFPVKKCTIKDIATFKIDTQQIGEHYRNAQTAMENETERLAREDHKRWAMDHFQQRGTVADRIASAALELSNPAQLTARSLNAFTVLFDIAQHDSHHFDAALNALVAVWPRLLPPRPLRKFSAQYFATLPDDENKRNFVLAHWYLEDLLKRTYTQFLTLGEVCLKDRLTQRREGWLNACGRLLPKVTEGRPTLISLIVDKLGDPNKVMAHKAYHQLLDMLCASSTYQSVLLTELEKLGLDNKHTTTKGRAYCIQVLAQFVFNKDEQKLALKVIEVYLALLRQSLAAGEADYSSTTAIIVGMRRCFPYAGNNFSALEEHVDTLFAFAATGPFLQRVHALSLVHQLYTKGWKSLEHRYYRALYSSLLVPSAQLPHSSQLAGYFTLLFKSLRQDISSANNQMMNSNNNNNNNTAADSKQKKGGDTTTGTTTTVLPEEASNERVAAFIHRMLQQCCFHNEAYVCSMLLMVGEFSRLSNLVAELLAPSSSSSSNSFATTADEKKKANNNKKQKNNSNEDAAAQNEESSLINTYDPRARDPRFARLSLQTLEKTKQDCYFELNMLSHHAHPSVARLAKALLNGDVIAFDVHPLDDLTLIHFLDMVTEGKTTAKKKPESEGKGVPVFHRNAHVPMLPKASDAAFAKVHPSSVDPNALFLHRFAHQRLKFLNDTKPRWKDVEIHQQEVEKMHSKVIDNRQAHFGPKPSVGTAIPAEREKKTTDGDQQISTNQQQQKLALDAAASQKQKQLSPYEQDLIEFNWGRIEDDEQWKQTTSKKNKKNQDGWGDDDDEDDNPLGFNDDFDSEDDDDQFPDFGQGAIRRGRNNDDDDDGGDFGGDYGFDDDDDDDDDGEDQYGFDKEDLADVDAVDDFDNEIERTQNKTLSKSKKREMAWLDKASGEAPMTPFNNANRGGGGGKKKKGAAGGVAGKKKQVGGSKRR